MKSPTLSKPTINKLLLFSLILISGIYIIIIRPLGPNLSQLPGDLVDGRFNNYILEHNFRWITGRINDLLNPQIAYPYPLTLTFSDNLFGSMLFYTFARWLGADRESAFQAWYILSFVLNFCAAAYVLDKHRLRPLAIVMGAFFFTFSLPVLAQETHVQLAYRFAIPLASFSLWEFSKKADLKYILYMVFWLVWQFYISIYLGFFLSLFLLVLMLGLILNNNFRPVVGILSFWPNIIHKAWIKSTLKTKAIISSVIFLLVFCLLILLLTYNISSITYGFERSWETVSKMLPRINSYLIADFSQIYSPLAYFSLDLLEYRNEHQLFIGLPAIFLLLLSLTTLYRTKYKKKIRVYLGLILFLILLTLNICGYSFYRLLFFLPGVHSIRAVTRLILVIIWPISFIISIMLDSLLNIKTNNNRPLIATILIFTIMFLESSLYIHRTFSITEARTRIQKLMEQIPLELPDDPILFVWHPSDRGPFVKEMDAMILAQDLGWPVLNAYSGNFPQGYGFTHDFDQAVVRIMRALEFRNELELTSYNNLITRVVPIGPVESNLPVEVPNLSVTYFPGPLPEELFSNIQIEIESVYRQNGFVCVEISILNNSSVPLPAESSTGNPFRISWRIIDRNHRPVTGFYRRKEIYSDLLPGSSISMTIILEPVFEQKGYLIEVNAVQEHIAWLSDKGFVPPMAPINPDLQYSYDHSD